MLDFFHADTPACAGSPDSANSSASGDATFASVVNRRKFLQKHKTMFPWIVHDPETDSVTCLTCQRARLRTEWSQGKCRPAGWKKDSFSRHHRYCFTLFPSLSGFSMLCSITVDHWTIDMLFGVRRPKLILRGHRWQQFRRVSKVSLG